MSRAILLAASLIIMGCGHAASTPAEADTARAHEELPIPIGATRDAVRARFGAPSRSAAEFDSFKDAGVVVDYEAERVSAVTVSLMTDGIAYAAPVLGVKLGDPLTTALETWGAPAERSPGPGYDRLVWRTAEHVIHVELWIDTHVEGAWGQVFADTVKRIQVRGSPAKP
ncbi:MAG: hypothetical protein IT385_13105 [Deltaproteobacteria bacterium]|nr:hypothetical protein [Deltaproteobacteria bacterium]